MAPAVLARAAALLDRLDAVIGAREEFDLQACVALNAAFHEALWVMPQSPLVEREIRRICSLPLAGPSAFLERQGVIPALRPSFTRSQFAHRAILEAIAAREGARAEALAREHARTARENLLQLDLDGAIAATVAGPTLVSTN